MPWERLRRMITERPELGYVALDLETTGLFAERDRIVEVGAVRFDAAGHELGRFEQLVNPGRPMSPGAQAVHGLSDAHLADAPSAHEVLPSFLDFLGDPSQSVLLAHNAAFDAGFLGRALARVGQPAPGHSIVDTLALSRRVIPESANHRLDTLTRRFGLDPGGLHRALADSLRVKGLWLALHGPDLPITSLVSYVIAERRGAAPIPDGWDLIMGAIAEGLTVRMEYDGGSRGPAPRDVTPRRFLHRGGRAYLVAQCHLDRREKAFRLDRVRCYQIVDPATVETMQAG